jgi:hypothetical protein
MRCLNRLASLLILAGSLSSCAPAASPDADPVISGEMHIFLLAGQSNMAGRGEVEAQDRTPHPRIWMLDRNLDWVPAADPIHFDKPIAGVGPGLTFARALVERDQELVIGLVPAAVGGSPISAWEPGAWYQETNSRPWDDALERVRFAMPSGELKAILWHQGESDSNGESAPLYQERLRRLVQRFRDELDDPDLPFLIGGLGCFPERPWNQWRATVDSAHRALPNVLPRAAFISADGLAHKGDTVHFNSEAARELGRRYANAYQQISDGIASPPAAQPACALVETAQ